MNSPIRNLVLVVEDDPLMRITLVTCLEDLGFEAIEAADGDHAVRLLEQHANRVRAVVADIHLPNTMNGVLLAQHTAVHWPSVRMALISGEAPPGPSMLPKDAKFFSKPFVLKVLLEQILDD
jgi:two-component system, response regulator PdtaR